MARFPLPPRRSGPPMAVWVLALVLVLTGCEEGPGADTKEAAPTTEAPADAGDKTAYCTLARELAAHRQAAAAKASNATEADQVFQQFARDHLSEARRLETVAPADIKKDVATLAQGLERVANGETTAFAEKKLLLADGRVSRYDATACPSP